MFASTIWRNRFDVGRQYLLLVGLEINGAIGLFLSSFAEENSILDSYFHDSLTAISAISDLMARLFFTTSFMLLRWKVTRKNVSKEFSFFFLSCWDEVSKQHVWIYLSDTLKAEQQTTLLSDGRRFCVHFSNATSKERATWKSLFLLTAEQSMNNLKQIRKLLPSYSSFLDIKPTLEEKKEKKTEIDFSLHFSTFSLDIVFSLRQSEAAHNCLCALKQLEALSFASTQHLTIAACEHLRNLMCFWFVTFAFAKPLDWHSILGEGRKDSAERLNQKRLSGYFLVSDFIRFGEGGEGKTSSRRRG